MTRPPTRPESAGRVRQYLEHQEYPRTASLRARTVELPPVSALRLVGQRQRGSRACAP